MFLRLIIIGAFLIVCCGSVFACLEESVNLDCTPCTIEQALDRLDNQVACSFSYNPSQFDLDEVLNGHYTNIPLKDALHSILGDHLKISNRGRHLLIESKEPVKSSPKKRSYIIEGTVKNARTGQIIRHATVYTVGNHYSALSDEKGHYRLEISTEETQLGLSYSKQEFFDTILIVRPAETPYRQDVSLSPRQKPLERMNPRDAHVPVDYEEVEMLPMVRFLVPEKQRNRAINLEFLEEIPFQASVVPALGTNRLTSGHSENTFSLNLIAGYNAGLSGMEVGSGVNILRQNAKGVQMAGVGNIVGGQTSGLQAAGIFNNVRGSVRGLQAAGVYNIVLDSLNGIQAGGVFNILEGSISGSQLAGVFNMATENMEGLQAAGVFNITTGDVTYAQMAGLFNTAGSMTGAQFAGFLNQSGDVTGSQFAGFLNEAGNVSGLQVSGFANISRNANIQIAGFLNVADTVKGIQIGFINISDSASSAIGFLSFSKKGYHNLEIYADEVHYANLSLRTGTERFHNIIGLGYGSYHGLDLISYRYGFGTEMKMKSPRFSLNLDLTGRQIFHLDNREHPMNLDIALDLGFAIKTGPVKIIMGPSLHMLIRNGQLQNLDPEEGDVFAIQNTFPPIFDEHKGRVSYNLWPGFRLGLRI